MSGLAVEISPNPITWSAVCIAAAYVVIQVVRTTANVVANRFSAETAVISNLSQSNHQTNERQWGEIGRLNGKLESLEKQERVHRAENHNLRDWANAVILIDTERRVRGREYLLKRGIPAEEIELVMGAPLPPVPKSVIQQMVEGNDDEPRT